MSGSGGLSPAEHHLGDRLAALVDGELGHDSRERVLAHLATCWKCKAEADAQRRLKSVFAEAEPPPLSDSLLARLQGLPGDRIGGGDRAGGGDGPDDGRAGSVGRMEAFALLPVGPLPRERGFRIHEVEPRGAARGRRFAFAAAGAVSLAAFALVGAQPLETAEAPRARGGGPSAATTSLAMTPGEAREERDLSRTRPAAKELPAPLTAAPVAAGVALLRPSRAPVLPPLVLTSHTHPAPSVAQPQAAPGRTAAAP
ncbi:zf-HC2 domain-containing protein [Streptomyces sp. NPDC046261]|uniref:zf-HC2 domain-containing protein n=1 Tax=Streptomyces sp. NPDC046261 TaxID=3157200 RepID=UPI0033E04614